MKISKTGQANITLENKNKVTIEFNRLGQKGKRNTKEYFWLSRQGSFTLNDLKQIVIAAEELLEVVNE